MGNLDDDNWEIVWESIKTATILHKLFTSVWTKENTENYQHFSGNRMTINNFTITTEKVGKYIKHMNATKTIHWKLQ